jgi:hypothetical protein
MLNSTFMTPAAPCQTFLPWHGPSDPVTTDELVANELHPAPQMQHWIKHTQQILFGDKNR